MLHVWQCIDPLKDIKEGVLQMEQVEEINTLADCSAASGCLNLTCCSTRIKALSKSKGMDSQRQSGA